MTCFPRSGEKDHPLLERSGICVVNLDLRLRVLEANRHFSRNFGYSGQDVTGRSFCDFLHLGVQRK